jgi:hypothetical protein
MLTSWKNRSSFFRPLESLTFVKYCFASRRTPKERVMK